MSSSALETSEQLSYLVIDKLREHIQSEIRQFDAEGRSHSSWNEYEDGVGWVDNEIGFLDQLNEEPERGKCSDSEFTPKKSVEACRRILVRRDVAYLKMALAFVGNGGTGIDGIFDLRSRADPMEIHTFLEELTASPPLQKKFHDKLIY